MIKFLYRKDKDYSRFNIIKDLVKDLSVKKDIYILMPFSKKVFIKNFLKRDYLVNDFFISDYDTYVYDRKKITKKNPRAWFKYTLDYINFKYSKYLLSDTKEHLIYWESLFGKFKGKHFVLPVLADTSIYFPDKTYETDKKIKIIFYGSFIPLHGIDKILKAFKILENSDINFSAKIIGNGQMYKNYKNLFNELELKNVSMDGSMLDEVTLADLIRNSDIVLGIFGDSKKAQSVVPNKVYQGLACKKAVITMKSMAIDEFFDSSEILTCKNDANSIAKSIKYLCDNKEEMEMLANNGYSKFKKLYFDTKDSFSNFLKSIDDKRQYQ